MLLAAGVALPPLQAFAWRNIGPAVAGGRTSGVAGTDADPNLYYFGGADGGVWKTTNGGLTWHDVWPRDAVGAIGAIAIDPRDRKRFGSEPASRTRATTPRTVTASG